jgi:hypothetical protein
MKRHRNPRPRLPKRPAPDNRRPASPAPPTFDLQGTLAVLRDDLGRADTMLVTADELIVQVWSGEGEDEGGNGDTLTRRRNHVSYLMEAARLAVRAAMRAGDEIDLHRGDV